VRIALIAAEPSGELQAAALARELKLHLPDVKLCGTGGRHMRAEGVELFFDSSVWSTVGLIETLPRIPRGLITFHQLYTRLVQTRPDLTVLIDAPGIMLRLSKKLKKANLRTLYYFPPSAWNPAPARARKIHSLVSAVLTTFRYNYQSYARAGLQVGYFGHPLVSLLQPLTRDEAFAQLSLDPSQRYLALLPGSRTQEIRLILPLFMEVARRLRVEMPGCHFLIPAATTQVEGMIRAKLGATPEWAHILSGGSREAIAAAHVAIVASGSVSVEAALLGVPIVLAYRVNRLDYFFGKLLKDLGLLRFRWFGLPNLVLQESVVPEFLQGEASPERLTAEALCLCDGQPQRERQLADLARVREALGPADSLERVGRFTAAFAQGLSLQESICKAGGNLALEGAHE
jgi:lipid-A-disaccharide synthase